MLEREARHLLDDLVLSLRLTTADPERFTAYSVTRLEALVVRAELRWLRRVFGVSADVLRECVRRVGGSVADLGV